MLNYQRVNLNVKMASEALTYPQVLKWSSLSEEVDFPELSAWIHWVYFKGKSDIETLAWL